MYMYRRKILLAAQMFEVWVIDDINAFLRPRLSKIPRVMRSLYAAAELVAASTSTLCSNPLTRYRSNLSEISLKFSKTFLRVRIKARQVYATVGVNELL